MDMTGTTSRLTLDAVRKEFVAPRTGDRVLAVEDVSLEIEAGEFLTIVGPSGCGKTTILNILAGLERASSGRATIGGRPILGPGAERGMVFQDYALFPWKTVFENVEFGLRYGPHGKGLAAGRPRPAGPTSSSSSSASPAASGNIPTSCRAGCASAAPSPGSWRTSPRCC